MMNPEDLRELIGRLGQFRRNTNTTRFGEEIMDEVAETVEETTRFDEEEGIVTEEVRRTHHAACGHYKTPTVHCAADACDARICPDCEPESKCARCGAYFCRAHKAQWIMKNLCNRCKWLHTVGL